MISIGYVPRKILNTSWNSGNFKLGLARLGPSGTGPSRTVQMVRNFYRTGPFTDGPGPEDHGPWSWLIAGPSGRSKTVNFLKQFYILCCIGTRNNIRKAKYRSFRRFLAVRTACRPLGPRSSTVRTVRTVQNPDGLDGPMVPDRPRIVRDRTVQKSWVRTVPFLSARASPTLNQVVLLFIHFCFPQWRHKFFWDAIFLKPNTLET